MRPNAPINKLRTQLARPKAVQLLYTFTDQPTTADNPTAGGVRPLNYQTTSPACMPRYRQHQAGRQTGSSLLVTSEDPAREAMLGLLKNIAKQTTQPDEHTAA